MVPGLGHGIPNGTSNTSTVIPNFSSGQMYGLLTDWVEKGIAPDRITLQATSGGTTRSTRTCVYPQKATYVSGEPGVAATYSRS